MPQGLIHVQQVGSVEVKHGHSRGDLLLVLQHRTAVMPLLVSTSRPWLSVREGKSYSASQTKCTTTKGVPHTII